MVERDDVRPSETISVTELYQPAPTVRRVTPDHGKTSGAVLVTVSGDGFVGAFEVHFGDRPIACPSRACQIVGPSQLRLTSPPHDAGTVPVIAARVGSGAPPPADPVTFTYGA